ncbi:hypothetical protein HYFRA_00002231 [Hymenoscyphus fraxineus]|uniref:DUF7730 domain-containing protein n=1 Tax=Hymenoscyphus fraxineus TaxID=746836 RepID=A0A9N9PP60_9HELO|nr:hypothetical protein HYFRA_00002231 [Hymenoscyphus fraxineus]
MSDQNTLSFKSLKDPTVSKIKAWFKKHILRTPTSHRKVKIPNSNLNASRQFTGHGCVEIDNLPLKTQSHSQLLNTSHPPASRQDISRTQPDTQDHSLFISTLPLEIRLEIYSYVLKGYGNVQHIFLSEAKLVHMPCALPHTHTYFQNMLTRNDCACDHYDATHSKTVQNGWEVIPLMLSCRKVYLEFIEVLYSSTTFYLYISGATRFVASVPTSHLALASFRVSFMTEYPMYSRTQNQDVNLGIEGGQIVSEARWEACWATFSNVKVRWLIVEIHDYGVRLPEQRLLQPLQRVRAERVEVVLPWPEGLAITGDFRNAGFVVRRPPEGVNLMIHNDVDKHSEYVYRTPSWWKSRW